eukprot:m.129191 g.129191  ORF g.129191 m.129191 type:complete len:255 (-) comp14750_c6_seq2:78-842(-)
MSFFAHTLDHSQQHLSLRPIWYSLIKTVVISKMALLYLEDFCESVEQLPQDMKHVLANVRSLDLRVQNTVDGVDKKLRAFYASAKKKTPDQREKELQEIKKEHSRALEACEEKCTLANQTHDLIERHIRRLEIELKKFAAELENTSPGVTAGLERKSLELDQTGDRSGLTVAAAAALELDPPTPLKRKYTQPDPPIVAPVAVVSAPATPVAVTAALTPAKPGTPIAKKKPYARKKQAAQEGEKKLLVKRHTYVK